MATVGGPRIVRNGLVLNLDAGQRTSYLGSGTAWNDLTGNRNNGTLTNGPTFNSANGGSIVFDGVDDHVLFSINSSINITNNITLECFTNISSYVSVGGIITFGTGSGEQYALFTAASPNRIILGTNWPSNWQQGATATTLNTNLWYHIAATFASGAWKIYLNGILDNSGTFAVTTLTSVANAYLTLGVNHPGGQEYLSGKISNVKIYNRVLSASEILQNYNTTKGRFGL